MGSMNKYQPSPVIVGSWPGFPTTGRKTQDGRPRRMGMSVAYVGDGETPVEAFAEFLSDRCKSLGRKNTYLGTFGTFWNHRMEVICYWMGFVLAPCSEMPILVWGLSLGAPKMRTVCLTCEILM